MIIGCFTLDLYCDCDNEAHEYFDFPAQFTGETRAACMKQARKKGWTFTKDRRGARCPKCKGKPIAMIGKV